MSYFKRPGQTILIIPNQKKPLKMAGFKIMPHSKSIKANVKNNNTVKSMLPELMIFELINDMFA